MDMTELIKKSNSKIPKVRFKMLLQKVFFCISLKGDFFCGETGIFVRQKTFFLTGRNEGAEDIMLHDAFDGHHSQRGAFGDEVDTELMLKSYRI